MNQTLEKAVNVARNLPEEQQEILARNLLERMEEMEINAKIEKAEAQGDWIPAQEVFKTLKDRMKKEYDL